MTWNPGTIAVDAGQVQAELDALSRWSEAEPPAVTRVVFTEEDLRARSFVKRLCVEAGLAVREDAVGNTFARWEGLRPELPAVATGSHVDAIPGAGRFDGTVGVLGGIEAIRALKRAGYRPTRSIELILFTSEEPTRFGVGCLGSRAMSGALGVEGLASLRDGEGRSLDEVRTAAGFSGPLDSVALPAGHYSAFVELHIEQGPLLEREGLPIGVVQAIAAPATLRIAIEGEGGHAGTVLMPDRRDPLPAAAEIILAVEAAARESGSPDSVATVGVCRVTPGAVNGIPSRVVLEVDLRDIDADRRDRMVDRVRAVTTRVAEARNLIASIETLNLDRPMQSDGQVSEPIHAACRDLGIPCRSMVSRAYHDALFMARVAPTAMIFIPSRGGYSHRPEEYSSPEQIATGVLVLAGTLARLSDDPREGP